MRRRSLSLAMVALGAALMVAAQLAGATSDRKGGIFKVGTTGASVQIDPQLAYVTTAWWLEYATAAKLYNYSPKGALVPEVASKLSVSNGGKRYTFFIRKGFRFSDGTPVTASSFKYAFDRASNRELASPAGQFITDVSAVRARGGRLIIDLKRPDGTFLSTIAMPFFQATSRKVPLTREVVNVSSIRDMPSAGPYAYSRNDVNVLTSIRRNPYWKPGFGPNRSRNLDGVDVEWNLDEQAAFDRVESNDLDEGPIPEAEVEGVANRYGVNRTRFWSKPSSCIGWIVFNNRAGLFQGNAPMRKAVNWALDRGHYLDATVAYSAVPWTHLLPPGFPGSITAKRLQPYAPTADIAKARTLAAGHFKDGKITVYYRSSGTVNQAQAQVVRQALIDLGFVPGDITMKGFAGGQIYDAIGQAGSDFDMGISMGVCPGHPDPLAFFESFPTALPAKYRNKIAAAARLQGKARLKAFGKLDLELTRKVAPVAVMRTYNNRYFFSGRVDPRSLRYHAVYEDWSIPALSLK
jgi:ABC-type transport system substrate-binding protein